MATYYIDSNRGNDSNAGTSISAAWQNLSKITSVVATAGDEFLLASDSEFNLTARVLLNSALGWSSTIFSPIRFGVYYPSGAYRTKPIIRKRTSIAAGSWTYSAPNNAWTFSADNTVSAYAYVRVGNTWATRTDNALPLDSVDGRWSNSGSTVYVYAPSGTNPTNYYGSVTFGGDSSDSAFVVSSPGSVSSFVFSGWRFEEVGSGIYVFNSTGTRKYLIEDMEALNTGAVFYCLTQTAGAVDLEINDVRARHGGTTFISANTAAGIGISRWSVKNCDLRDGNYGFPQGLIYSQVRTGAEIIGNRISNARYGVNGKSSDGAAIYTETQSDNNLIRGNYIEDCYLAFQDNSGRSSTWIGNVVNNCYATMKVTDTTPNSATNLTFRNNTVLNAGCPIDPVAGSMAGIGFWAATNTTPAQNFDIQNNLMVAHESASGAAIELPTSATGTIAYNNLVGFSATAESWDGTAADITPTNTTSHAPQLNRQNMPMNASLQTAGANLGGLDFYGKEFAPTPTIGAVQYQPARSLTTATVTTRTVVSREVTERRAVTV